MTLKSETAPSLLIPHKPVKAGRRSNRADDEVVEYPCVICGRPVNTKGHHFMVWVHLGGSHVVTRAEGEWLNANGRAGADLGAQPIGKDCLRRHPEFKAYIIKEVKNQ